MTITPHTQTHVFSTPLKSSNGAGNSVGVSGATSACAIVVLDEHYIPPDEITKAAFKEMQIFMYAVMEEHLQMDKGKSLVSQYEEDHDAQKIYCDLKKHALGSTAAQLSGDTLLKYFTTACYPDNWRGTPFAFVLVWQEQARRYERLELEEFPLRQKLCMIHNDVGDVTEWKLSRNWLILVFQMGNESYVA
jgi:hypothetical protein